MGRRFLLGVLAYGLWLASAALALGAMLLLRQFLLIDLPINVLLPMGLSQYGQRAIDRFGTVILGLTWLIFVVASESYFRKLIDRQIQPRQVVRLFVVEALVLVLAFAGSALVS
jgi:hypothetical protein